MKYAFYEEKNNRSCIIIPFKQVTFVCTTDEYVSISYGPENDYYTLKTEDREDQLWNYIGWLENSEGM
ncbi:MAG: hypothetical protein PHF86_09620 [Candidatus Nanoarchaeia archaeon]|nr:hypothetical protein [Candidatus Nanoarchaeia archaeon]